MIFLYFLQKFCSKSDNENNPIVISYNLKDIFLNRTPLMQLLTNITTADMGPGTRSDACFKSGEFF